MSGFVENRPSYRIAHGERGPTGKLASWPLPLLFVDIIDHRLSGSLVLIAPSGDVDVVVFSEGAPTRVRTAKLVAPLGEMLVRYGVLANVDIEAAVSRAAAAKARIGQQLVSERIIDRRVLLEALREQTMVRLRRVATVPEGGSYEFHSNSDLLDDGAPTNATMCDPLAALLALVRAWPDRRRVDAFLEERAELPAKLHGAAEPERFELADAELAVLERIKQSTATYGSLLHSTLAPTDTIRALLYALGVSHHLDDGRGSYPLDVELPPESTSSLRDSSLGRGVGKARTDVVKRQVGAADDAREAELLLRAGKLEEAEELATRATENDPETPSFRALLGHILAVRKPEDADGRALALLDSAIADDPQDDRALVYRASLHQCAGRVEAARADYRAAQGINATNSEAARALRQSGVRGNPVARRGFTPLPSPVPPALHSRIGDGAPPPPRSYVGLATAMVVAATLVLLAYYLLVLRHR